MPLTTFAGNLLANVNVLRYICYMLSAHPPVKQRNFDKYQICRQIILWILSATEI